MVLLLAYCGHRWVETAGLRVPDCNPVQRRIDIANNAVQAGSTAIVGTPETHRRRTVPVPMFIVDRLTEQCRGWTQTTCALGARPASTCARLVAREVGSKAPSSGPGFQG